MNGRRLYQEIGGVDERYLQQAVVYRARKQAPAWRAVLIAAVLTLVGALLLCTVAASVAIGVIGGLLWSEGNDPQPAPDIPMVQMEQVMQASQDRLEPLSAEELPLFAGPLLIFSEQGSDAYYAVTLTTSECERLVTLMQSQNRTEYTKQSQEPAYQIWLSFGDGMVVSPYLKNTAGNAGHGEVFDYDPELEMSDDLAELIARYIET